MVMANFEETPLLSNSVDACNLSSSMVCYFLDVERRQDLYPLATRGTIEAALDPLILPSSFVHTTPFV
jgi:hypothetical protein